MESHDPAVSLLWKSAPPLRIPRAHHTATLTGLGVLVVGGAGALRTTEVLPHVEGDGRWLVGPALEVQRPYGHATVRLSNMKVIVTGGTSASKLQLKSVEISQCLGTLSSDSDPLSCDGLSRTVPHVEPKTSMGTGYVCQLMETGVVRCWGTNIHSALGAPGFVTTQTAALAAANPVPATEVSGGPPLLARDIAVGAAHTCAIESNAFSDAVRCWGQAGNGALGDGRATSSPDRFVPSYVLDDDDGTKLQHARSIVAGTDHSCAIVGSKVKCWGYNEQGELGNGVGGTSIRATTVVGLPEGDPPKSLASGEHHTCALLRSGAVYCWGRNAFHQLGVALAGMLNSRRALRVSGANGVQISAGVENVCVLEGKGIVSCWGLIDEQRRPNATPRTVKEQSPTGPIVMEGVVRIASSRLTNCALTRILFETVVKCWGTNDLYELGHPGNQNWIAGTPVSGLSSPIDVYMGGHTGCALADDGVLRCWGSNKHGQLGAPGAMKSAVAVLVP